MSSHPAGAVSNRRKAAAIKLLADTIDDPGAALYLKVQSARTLLQQQKIEPKDEAEDEFPSGNGAKIIIVPRGETYQPVEGSGKVIVLPSNGRENIAEERRLERLAALAELPITDGDEPEPLPEPAVANKRKLTGRERLRLMRARRRATRDAPAIW